MSVGVAFIAGNDAVPELANEACRMALARTGENCANSVLLFLTAEFTRHAQQSAPAVARAVRRSPGESPPVSFNRDCVLDRPAAVMVFSGGLTLDHPEIGATEPLLSYAGSSLPQGWGDAGSSRRFSGSFSGTTGRSDPVTWQKRRFAGQCSLQLPGAQVEVDASMGWRLLGAAQTVDSSSDFEFLTIGGQKAIDSLLAAVNDEAHTDPLSEPPAITVLDALLIERGAPFVEAAQQPIATIGIGRGVTLTLTERVAAGQLLAWAISLPQASEEDARCSVARLSSRARSPRRRRFLRHRPRAVYFYGGEDRDVACLRQRFPRLPLIGTYGTEQTAPSPTGGNRLQHNSVATTLISGPAGRSDVQSEP